MQKAQMTTLIEQSLQEYNEQVKIFQECVKQYEESVKIYNQAIKTYNWIDRNIGDATKLKTFLAGDFAHANNINDLLSLVNMVLTKSATDIDENYSLKLLREVDWIIQKSFMESEANKLIDVEKEAQATSAVANKGNNITQDMLNKLRTKDKILENKVTAGNPDLMQLVHAQEQTTVFLAEEAARINLNIAQLAKAASGYYNNQSHQELMTLQQNALDVKLNKDALDKTSKNLQMTNTRKKMRDLFSQGRLF
jgi:hypothetical protein